MIKSRYVGSLACVRVIGSESKQFRIDSGVRQGCIMFPWLFNVYKETVMEVKMGIGNRQEWRLPDLLYPVDLVLYGELEEDLRAMVEWSVEVCM